MGIYVFSFLTKAVTRVTALTTLSLVLTGCCSYHGGWPTHGQGGMAEHSYDAVTVVYSSMDVFELGRKIYHAKTALEDLHTVGAGEHYPAAYLSIETLLHRTMREYHGGLYKEAELDLIIMNELMHKLDHALQEIKL